ncbi:MAG: hypothetical protein B7W99_00905 [Rhodospirillales bacterium 20-58-10]|nr:MAG: hypothetical protein B7W99_00905 [Rhodospirillales bacterium 20-58-10]
MNTDQTEDGFRQSQEDVATASAQSEQQADTEQQVTPRWPESDRDPDGPGKGPKGGPAVPPLESSQQAPHVDTVWMEPSAELTEADERDMAEAFKPIPGPGNDNRPELAAIVSEQPEAGPRFASEEEWADATHEQWKAADRAIGELERREIFAQAAADPGGRAAEEAERIAAAEQAQQGEPMTLEAIGRDPWNAVNLPFPENADCELVGVVQGTAFTLADTGAGPEPDLLKAEERGRDATALLDEMACNDRPGTVERDAALPEIDTAASARPEADAAMSDLQAQREQGIADRIVALETLLGSQESDSHKAYVAAQADYSDRIAATDDPAMRNFLTTGKLANSQDYAAELCDNAGIKEGLDGRYDEAAALIYEATTHREIANELRGAEPSQTPPEPGNERGDIAQDMEAAAAEALGRTARAEIVVEGPSAEQQHGQRPDPHDIRGEPGKGDYASLREETAALAEDDDRTKIANHAFNIRPVMEVSPEGTYIASRPQSDFAQRETDYENGPIRPGFESVAAANLSDAQEAARELEETRIADASQKAKQENEGGAKAAELGTSTGQENADSAKSADPVEVFKRMAAEAMEAAEAERTQDTGRSMGGIDR